ncbi:uncharacterized protein BO88DRAFT_484478 [Aspergillus vadensis CBS 113365]|uniref:Uncharacterized protein n=1 Tax=Aspergillus vadensis (strain CBS 113365 / IMI 142717 / IBT 24658) TaxID=1448311 RepID=A0A319C5H2_ASPVC|nr:hypothetical protein BO88DRAFT_484478 [Aspergillus vadensis CBS 113365]PYH73563.1 hypothetical protein BO88DRAFT_484478 [Aspergillus vadensis CBS 113365]
MVGITSYGRSFEITTVGCTGPECTYVGPDSGATPGRYTQTAGYITNAEINEIIASNPTVQVLFNSGSDSDIIVYNETQWVIYMTNTTKSTRTSYYKAFDAFLLKLEVNETFLKNDTCSDPAAGETSEQASEERGIAAYIDWLVKDSFKSPSEWANRMFKSTGQTTQCDIYPDSQCNFPSGFCSNYTIPSEYWAEYVVANFHEYITEFGSLFNYVNQNQSLGIDTIVADFPVKSSSTVPDLATIFTNVGGALGIVGSTLPLLDEETDTASSMMGVMSGLFSTAGSDISSSSATDTETITLEKKVEAIYSLMYTAVQDILIDVFETGNISSWPSDLRSGDYSFEVANFFNGRYMFLLTGEQAESLESTFNTYLQQYLVGSALASANYYVLKSAYSTSTYSSITSGKNTTGTYGGTLKINILEFSSSLPTCFYNLPVFTVETSEEPKVNNNLSSPCLVYEQNLTAKTAELGVTWLPSNLADIFVKDFCECNAGAREYSEI